MIDPKQLLNEIIRPVIKDLALWSANAERLILGTACQESACGKYLVQIRGPALGIFQMEPPTHDDIWNNFLRYRPDLAEKINLLAINDTPTAEEMTGNLYYAAAMCRVHYLRDSEPIPTTLAGQAAYWKRVYNTEAGKGTIGEYMNNWDRYCSPFILETEWV
jgi:hypothetical protein